MFSFRIVPVLVLQLEKVIEIVLDPHLQEEEKETTVNQDMKEEVHLQEESTVQGTTEEVHHQDVMLIQEKKKEESKNMKSRVQEFTKIQSLLVTSHMTPLGMN